MPGTKDTIKALDKRDLIFSFIGTMNYESSGGYFFMYSTNEHLVNTYQEPTLFQTGGGNNYKKGVESNQADHQGDKQMGGFWSGPVQGECAEQNGVTEHD